MTNPPLPKASAAAIGTMAKPVHRMGKIARALFTIWLICWPVTVFAHPANVARQSAFTAPGAFAPGQIEGQYQ